MTILEKAHQFAKDAHEGQVRKFSGEPYITHPEAVSQIAPRVLQEVLKRSSYNNDELPDPRYELSQVVGLLHDTVEDTDVSQEDVGQQFGRDVAVAVDLLTRKENDDYFPFILRLLKSGNIVAMSVKVADISHNLQGLKKGSLRDKYFLAKYTLEKELGIVA
jgi:(p)ppGpp synthase/HD superfamily hydrolase